MTDRIIKWDRGEAEIQLLGGMLGPVRFRLENDRVVQPLAIAPWGDDRGAEHENLPGLLKRLRGEWPCVPFGEPDVPAGLPEAWRPAATNPVGSDFHGYGANHPWVVEEQEEHAITIVSDYPEDHPVRRLRRRIAGLRRESRLAISLTIEVRREIEAPIALHPVFRLPANPERARLDLGRFDMGRVFPLPVEPGRSRLVPDAVFETIRKVPAEAGTVGLDRLPLAFDTEELVQICGASGRATLTNEEEGYQVQLDFDPEVFSSILLWVSNRGRRSYPWNGRFVALGIEPVRAAFDLGPDVGCDPRNPIARAGYATALLLKPDAPFMTRYSIGVAGIGGS